MALFGIARSNGACSGASHLGRADRLRLERREKGEPQGERGAVIGNFFLYLRGRGTQISKFMKSICVFTLFLAALLMWGCGGREEAEVDIASGDAELREAIAAARETLDRFWDRREDEQDRFQGLLRVYFEDFGVMEEGERLWVQVTERGDRIAGIVVSKPQWLDSVHEGSQVRFTEDRIADWLYVEDGRAVGAYTARVERARMTPGELREHDGRFDFSFE